MDFLVFIHFVIILIVVSMPFWPIEYLQYGVYIPLLISIMWIFCDGCPLTKLHNPDGGSDSFSNGILRIFIPDASISLTQHVNTFILVFITVIGFRRLDSHCKSPLVG